MYYVLRRSDAPEKTPYPLPITETVHWHRGEANEWVTHILLPPIPPKHIIVPSFSTVNASAAYQFTLRHGAANADLQPVPAHGRRQTLRNDRGTHVTTHIDCWHSTHKLSDATIELRVRGKQPPGQCLLIVSVRPLQIKVDVPEKCDIPGTPPRPLSQMQAPRSIARGICSPTATSMALAGSRYAPSWAGAIRACYDPWTRAFGAWPLATRWAGQQGVVAGVEVLPDWSVVTRILQKQAGLVCSINFAAGELSDAPLKSTGGHLVMLYGIKDNYALVADPAAPTHDAVLRRYDLKQFSAAWLHQRGAAYILATDRS